MTTFRVWAPKAQRGVELVVGDRRQPMRRVDNDWFEADVDGAGSGTEYTFAVDGGPPTPDPRSGWQPYGVHGASRLIDHDRFPWTDNDWRGTHLPSAVIYECHIGTFTPEGDFDAAIRRLDHLVDLGVTAVEVMPVAAFSGERGWGYDGVQLCAPHIAYGGPDGFKRFVDACHNRGLGVILDVVYNHLGPEGNYLGRFGPYFTDFYSTPWGSAVNFDQRGSDEVRRFVCDNALGWLRDYHVDGLRIDAVHAIVDTSATHVLEQMAVEVEALSAQVGRPLFLIAESDLNDPRLVASREAGGYGLDAQWSDDFHHALHAVLTGETNGYYEDFGAIGDIATALEQTFVYAGRYSEHRGRTHGRSPAGLPTTRFLGYLQNHDQVGNRATGDRISQSVGADRLKVGAALVLTSPFVPMLFQGEEWGARTPFQYFTDHQDSELGRAVSQGRRSEFAAFGWKADEVPDPQDPATFERSKLDWNELERGEHAELLAWHRDLIQLRRQQPSLSDGQPARVRHDDATGWLVVHRGLVTIAANLGAGEVTLAVDESGDRSCTPLLVSSESVQVSDGKVTLPPDSVAVLGPPA
jgi:maltooligosyltrehalose trehalohydrolase